MTVAPEPLPFSIAVPALIAASLIWIAGLAATSSQPQTSVLFSDCVGCPKMVRIPPGSFQQGDLQTTGDSDERPTRRVTFSQPFALSRTEITYAQWDKCVARGACEALTEEDLSQTTRARRPVQNVSWSDAKDFVVWLSRETGRVYRLPTESEFEYAARAGTDTRYAWGDNASRAHANYGDDACCGGLAAGADKWFFPATVASFSANAFGLHDMAGNVQEWVEDCWLESYEKAPQDGSPRVRDGDCDLRVLRGGSWSSTPKMIRPANRDKGAVDARLPYYGFRVARDL